MTAIGCQRAWNLIRRLDWKMLATVHGDSINQIVLYHPKQDHKYKVRIDSGIKLWTKVLREVAQCA